MKRSVVLLGLTILLASCSSAGSVVGAENGISAVLSASSPTEIQPDNTDNAVVAGTVNVRECPSTSCAVVGYLYSGQDVRVLACIGNWCQMAEGYVYAPCLGHGEGICR